MAKAIEIAFSTFDTRDAYVCELKDYLVHKLSKIDNVVINSSHFCIPFIVNISILNTKPDEVLTYFSDKGIYLSSKSACSGQEEFSESVYAITMDSERAKSSYRISLSHLSTKAEIDVLIDAIERIYDEN